MTSQLSRFAPALSPFVVAALCSSAGAAQQRDIVAKPAGSASPASIAATQAAPGSNAAMDGLPAMLKPVPKGDVWLGVTAEQLIDAAAQAVSPLDPKRADAKQVGVALKNMASSLGHTRETIDDFYLGQWLVTNKEYEVFVKQTGHRFPYHWWRFGRKDDYEQRIEAINREFPGLKDQAALAFWKMHWQDQQLPYKLVDGDGNSIDDLPVTFVSYRDANDFAAWLGMRLPTEPELTRAAKGDADIVFPWGNRQDGPGDKLTEQVLELLQIKNYRDQRLKRAGEVQFSTGPFGHFSLVGNAWVFTSSRQMKPLCGSKDYEKQLAEVRKNRLAALMDTPNVYKDDEVVLKGSSFMAGGQPVSLAVDSRASMISTDVVESVGVRLAKSPRPGYDMLFSLLRGKFKTTQFSTGQEIDLAQQLGLERYEFGADGFPTAYQAVSFAPVNWISNAKGVTLKGLVEKSQLRPIPLGALATTVPLLEPELKPDEYPAIYTVCYRQKGKPKELLDAIKEGYKEVQARLRKKTDKEKEGEEPAAAKEVGKDDWRAVLKRFGLTEQDLEPKGADAKLDFVRITGVDVTTEANVLLFFDNDGMVKGVLPLRDTLPVASSLVSSLKIGEAKRKDGQRLQLELHFGMPLDDKNDRKLADVSCTLVLDLPPVGADKPWRLPAVPGSK